MKKFLVILLTVVMCVACFAGCGDPGNSPSGSPSGSPSNGDDPLVGLICLHGESSTYDKNFIDAFKAACEAKGLNEDQYVIVTDIPEGEECYTQAVNLAEQGVKAIFADSFGHESFMLRAAEEYPEIEFCHATGTMAHTENLANFHNAFASIYEGRFLAGVAAGAKLAEMIDNGDITDVSAVKVGYVGAFPYEEVKSGYTSWFLGVKHGLMYAGMTAESASSSSYMQAYVGLTMQVEFTNSWYDQTKEYDAATKLIEDGCVLISQHADSMGAPNACEENNVPNVAYNGSTEAQCPDTYIISSRINWQPYFELMIESAVNGNGEIPEDYTGSMADGSVVVSTPGAAAADNTADAINYWKSMLEQGYEVFTTKQIMGTQEAPMITIGGQPIADDTMANVDTDAAFTADTEVIKEKTITLTNPLDPTQTQELTIRYFAESFFRSAPYFGLDIDGIILPSAE